MANPFDYDTYFSNKAAEANDPLVQKLDGIVATHDKKLEELEDTSWVKKYNLDPNSVAGNVVDTAASLVSGASRVAGHLRQLPNSVTASIYNANVDNSHISAYNRFQGGKATPQDINLLNTRPSPNLQTPLENIKASQANRAAAQEINEYHNVRNIVDQSGREAFTKEIGEGFEKNYSEATEGVDEIKEGEFIAGLSKLTSGVGKLIANAGSAVLNNKATAVEYIVENIPQLALGVFGKAGTIALVSSNAGYAIEQYQMGLEAYKKKHNGQLPSVEKQEEMAGNALMLAVVEHGSDVVSLGMTKLAGKAVTKAAGDAANRTSIPKAVKETAKGGTVGLITEAPTEAYQTYIEGKIVDEPATPKDIFTSGVIGGVAGLGLAGSGRALHEGAKLSAQKARFKDDPIEKGLAERSAAAIESGDINSMVDPANKKTYAPDEAIRALHGNAKREDTTEETKQEHLKTADDAIEALVKKETALEGILESTETLQGIVNKASLQVQELESAESPDLSRITELKTIVDAYQSEIDRRKDKGELSKAERKAYEKELAEKKAILVRARKEKVELDEYVIPNKVMDKLIDKAAGTDTLTPEMSAAIDFIKSFDDAGGAVMSTAPMKRVAEALGLTLDSKEKPEALAERIREKIVGSANTKEVAATPSDNTEATRAANIVITHAMKNTDRVPTEKLKKIANNKGNGLTKSQRDFLRKVAKARELKKFSEGLVLTSKDIFEGNQGNKGLLQHTQVFNKAIKANKANEAANEIDALKKFATAHSDKAWALSNIHAALKPNEEVQAVLDANKGWSVNKGETLSPAELKKRNGLIIRKTSFKLIDAIKSEARALKAALTAMESQYNLVFSNIPLDDLKGGGDDDDQASVVKTKETEQVKAEVKKSTAKQRAESKKVITSDDTMNEAIIKMGGISTALKLDITGDTKGNQGIPFVGALFKEDGKFTDLSDLATQLEQYGYFTQAELEDVDGGAQLLRDRIREEYDGGEAHKRSSEIEDEAEAAMQERAEQDQENTEGITTYPNGIKVLENFASADNVKKYQEIIKDNRLETQKARHTAWFGPVNYEYSGRYKHKKKEMPEEFVEIAEALEQKLGYKKGYLNSGLMNVIPAGNGISKHADAESIFLRDNKTIGSVVTVSFGGEAEITITRKDGKEADMSFKAKSGDVYTMPDGKFQHEYFHAVGAAKTNRISLTFRHIPRSVIEKAKPKEEAKLGDFNIWNRSKENEILSNLASRPFEFKFKDDTRFYKSVEHAYQTLKTGEINEVIWEPKKWGDGSKFRDPKAKEDRKTNIDLMERLIRASFEFGTDKATEALALLKDSGNRTITHKGRYGSDIWTTEFPRILMKIRDEKNKESTKETTKTPGLRAFNNKSPEGTEPNLINVLSEFYKQAHNAGVDGKSQPLVEVDNFRTTLIAGNFPEIKEFFSSNEKVEQKQKNVLNTFVNVAAGWESSIQNNLPEKERAAEYKRNDLVKYFVEGTGEARDVEQNFKTAISLAVFTYIAEHANDPEFLSDASINNLLDREDDVRVSNTAYGVLGKSGVRQSTLFTNLGGVVMNALGIKALPNANQNVTSKFQQNLGAHAAKLAEDQGLLQRTTVDGVVLETLRREGLSDRNLVKLDSTDTKAIFHYYAIKRTDNSSSITEKAATIRNASAGTKGIISKLFSLETKQRDPSLEPFTLVQNRTTNAEVPALLQKAFKAKQKRAQNIKANTYNVLNSLDQNNLEEVIGAERVDEKTSHVSRLASKRAKYAAKIGEFENLKSFIENTLEVTKNGINQEYFLKYSAWDNQRSSIENSNVSAQASKIVRYLTGATEWKTKIKLSDDTLMDSFFLRVSEGLGVKTENADPDISIVEVKETLKDPVYVAAIDALSSMVVSDAKTLTTSQQQSIVEAVRKGKQSVHTLDVLVGMALHNEAIKQAEVTGNNDTTFTVEMSGIVDAVASGTMLNSIYFGAYRSAEQLIEFGEKGGFYTEESGVQNFSEWRGKPGNLDVYESNGVLVRKLANENHKTQKSVDTAGFNSLFILGESLFAGHMRSLIKDAMNPMIFSSSMSRIKEHIAETFFDEVIDGFEALAQDRYTNKSQEQQQQELNEYVQHINAVMNTSQEKFPANLLLPVGKSMEHYLKEEFLDTLEGVARRDEQVKAIKKVFNLVIGKAVSRTLQDEHSVFLERKKQFNDTAQLVSSIYNAVYEGEREAYIKELVASGELPLIPKGTRIDKNKQVVETGGKRYNDLTKKQEKELEARLQKIRPMLHTVMSKKGRNLDAGLLMTKRGTDASHGDPTYKGTAYFGLKNAIGALSTKFTGRKLSYKDIGLGAGAAAIHSADAGIATEAQIEHPNSTNLHDALQSSVASIVEVGKYLNKATYENLRDFSPAAEMFTVLANQIDVLSSLVKDNEVSPETKVNLVKVLDDLFEKQTEDTKKLTGSFSNIHKPEHALMRIIMEAKENAFISDRTKLEFLSKVTQVSHYALPGTEHEVSLEEREAAQIELDQLSNEIGTELYENVFKLQAALDGKKRKSYSPYVPPRIEAKLSEYIEPKEKNPPKKLSEMTAKETASDYKGNVPPEQQELLLEIESQFGILGTPNVKSDPALVKLFNNDKTTAKKVITTLLAKYEGQEDLTNRKFNISLLKRIQKAVPPDLPIIYVTSKTKKEDVISQPEDMNIFGWYTLDTKSKKQAIYILNSEFKSSGLTSEVLMHELLHAAVLSRIKKGDKQVTPFVKELNSLLEQAREYIEINKLTKFKPATSNLDEFISWGMTNTEFQEEVLNKLVVNQKSEPKPVKGGLRKFFEQIAGLVFGAWSQSGYTKSTAVTGLEVLNKNVSNILDQANAEQNTIDKASDGIINTPMSAEAKTNAKIDSYTTAEIFKSFPSNGTVNPEFKKQLEGLLENIVTKIHGPFGSFKERFSKNIAHTPAEVWLKALDTGKAPFASDILSSGFSKSGQQGFVIEQVEATVRAALSNAPKTITSQAIHRELRRLYSETKLQLTPEDFRGKFGANTLEEATALYNYVYDAKRNEDGTSDYLSRFAALGLAHEEFNGLLKITAKSRISKKSGRTFYDRLRDIWSNIVAFINKRLVRIFDGQLVDERLDVLVEQLVDIEARRKQNLKVDSQKVNTYVEAAETKTKKAVEKLSGTLSEVLKSDRIQKSSSGIVRGVGAVTRTVIEGRLNNILQAGVEYRDRYSEEQLKLSEGLLNAIKTPIEAFEMLVRGRTFIEGLQIKRVSNVSALVTNAFANKRLPEDTKAAITSVLLRTGVHNLLTAGFSLDALANLINNRIALENEISKLESKLDKFGALKEEFIRRSNALGIHQVDNTTRIGDMAWSAHQISRRFGDNRNVDKLNANQLEESDAILKQLITLYALLHVESGDSSSIAGGLVKNLMLTENSRSETEGNGIAVVLNLHAFEETEALNRGFGENPALMHHGYVPEIYNYRTKLETANEKDGKILIDQGYLKSPAAVRRDPADKNKEIQYIYILRDGGSSRMLSAAVGAGSTMMKGTAAYDNYMRMNTLAGQINATTHAGIMAHRRNKKNQMHLKPGWDINKVTENYMAPVYNEAGEAVTHRYLMSSATKDNLLERNNAFDSVLGQLSGSIYGKRNTVEQNRIAITVMLEQYKIDYAIRGKSYVLVGKESTDPLLKDIWSKLPQETKDDVREIWDREGMLVRKDSLDILFGYPKISAADPFRRVNEERKHWEAFYNQNEPFLLRDAQSVNMVQKIFIGLLEGALTQSAIARGIEPYAAKNYAKRAANLVSKGENVWQGVITEVKDIVVIKSIVVMLGNMTANSSLLHLQGVSWADISKNTIVAYKGAIAHRADSDELESLRLSLSIGYTKGDSKKIQQRIVELEDSIARNPVTPLIESGLMPSIVEDVDIGVTVDPYSFKSVLTKKVEKQLDKLPVPVVTALRTAWMTRDGKLYQNLAHLTQMSDFTARYVLYQHQTTRTKDELSHKEAISRASRAFVNYDIALHRWLQYTDDMGLTMFTKYFLYIQSELIRVAKENPARTLSLFALRNYLDSLPPDVLESSGLSRIGNNPLGEGPLRIIDAIQKLPAWVAIMAIFK